MSRCHTFCLAKRFPKTQSPHLISPPMSDILLNMKYTSKIPIIDIKKYGGKQVAIINGEIAASGKSTREVLKKVRERYPQKDQSEILLFSVPRGLPVIYRI